MNTKTLLAALVGAITAFLLGWVVYGMMMDPIYKAHSNQFEGLMKDPPNLILIFVGGFASSLLIAIICSWSNMVGLMKGAVIGATVGFLTSLNYDMFTLAMQNMFKDSMIVIVDIVVSTIFMGIVGGVIGWMMGMGKKPETATA